MSVGQRDRDGVVGEVAAGEIEVAVAVEVGGYRAAQAGPGDDGGPAREAAAPVAVGHQHRLLQHVGPQHIDGIVTVDVDEADVEHAMAVVDDVERWPEAAAPVAVRDLDLVAAPGGDGQIQRAVAVDVGGGHRRRRLADRQIARRPEAALAVVQVDGDPRVAFLGHGDVGGAVAVEIGGGEHERMRARRQQGVRGEEGAGAGAAMHGDDVLHVAADREVELAVAVEIGDGDAAREATGAAPGRRR